MKTDIVVPEIGESISSGILAAWLKSDGDLIAAGEEVFELETDKATLAVPSPAAGALKISAAEGDEVAVGQVVGTIDTASSGTVSEPAASEPAASPATTAVADAAVARESSPEPPAVARTSAADVVLSPAVRRVVEEHGLDASRITGTGKGGRITKEDALKAVEANAAGSTIDTVSGVDASRARSAAPAPRDSRPADAAPSAPAREGQRRVPLSNLRRRIAENLVASKQNSAHVTTFNEVDMSTVMAMRARYKETFQEKYGVRLGFMSFFIKASQFALQQTPEVNAYLDGGDVVYNEQVNIGVALSSERGLLTPVIKDVAGQCFGDVENTIIDFITRANNKRLRPDEMTGATFTISNGGVFGSLLSTPIPSPPQTAVLGMHAIEKRPVVVNDEIVIRPMMYLALTYDHRMIDGREAVGFLGKIKQFVEDPTAILLGL